MTIKRTTCTVNLPANLRRLRERAGLSQRQLAHRIGVCQPRIAEIESGRVRSPRVVILLRLIDALGCTLDQLVR